VGGPLAQLLGDLASDRRVPLELGRLGAVLEEGQPVLGRVGPSVVLGLVHVAPGLDNLGAQILEQRQLGRARLLGKEHHSAHARPLRRPRRCRAVIAGRGGDHRGRATGPKGLECRQRSTPLEGTQLVRVLALEEQATSTGEDGRRLLQRRGREHRLGRLVSA
jgi:hypothetical protein